MGFQGFHSFDPMDTRAARGGATWEAPRTVSSRSPIPPYPLWRPATPAPGHHFRLQGQAPSRWDRFGRGNGRGHLPGTLTFAIRPRPGNMFQALAAGHDKDRREKQTCSSLLCLVDKPHSSQEGDKRVQWVLFVQCLYKRFSIVLLNSSTVLV